jgi:hypothetical protein
MVQRCTIHACPVRHRANKVTLALDRHHHRAYLGFMNDTGRLVQYLQAHGVDVVKAGSGGLLVWEEGSEPSPDGARLYRRIVGVDATWAAVRAWLGY